MATRALVIVGGGSSSRFGRDKLLEDIAGEPLVKRTISAVVEHVDTCVLVTRAGLVATMQDMDLGVRVVAGGSTRTQSEIAGLASLDHSYDLIGIHDAARPSVHALNLTRVVLPDYNCLIVNGIVEAVP